MVKRLVLQKWTCREAEVVLRLLHSLVVVGAPLDGVNMALRFAVEGL